MSSKLLKEALEVLGNPDISTRRVASGGRLRSENMVEVGGVSFDTKAMAKAIEDHVSRLIGTKITIPNIEIYEQRGSIRMRFESNDIKHSPKIFKRLYVIPFSNEFVDDKGYFWVNINYRYEHFPSGSNGTDITTLWIYPDGKIENSRDVI